MPYSSSSVEWSGVRAVLQIVETPFFTGFDHYPLFYSFVRNRVFCFDGKEKACPIVSHTNAFRHGRGGLLAVIVRRWRAII